MLLFTEPISKERARVTSIHFKPELLSTEQVSRGISVNSVPEPGLIKGKMAVHYVNPLTKKQWFEYVDRPLTQEEISADMLAKLDEISAKLTELINIQKG